MQLKCHKQTHLKETGLRTADKQIPIFVVSLADAANRRLQIASALDRLGLEFSFVDAIDGRDKLPKTYEHQVDRATAQRRLKRPITDPELACALSHVYLYEKLAKSEESGAIILEDDAIIDEDLKIFIEGNHYEGEDFILLGHGSARVSWFYKRHVFNQYFFRKLNFPACATVGYYITKEVAGGLFRESIPVSHVADWVADITRFNAIAISPPIVRHLPFGLDNSALEAARGAAELMREAKSPRRYLQSEYWRLRLLRLISVKIPGSNIEAKPMVRGIDKIESE